MTGGNRVVDELENDSSVVYMLDARLHVEYCNRAWDDFARANGGHELVRPNILGKLVLDYVEGPLRRYYRKIFNHVLKDRRPWEHSYECSSPAVFRLFRMRIMPLEASQTILIVNSLEMEKAHDRQSFKPALEEYRNADGLIIMCSNCRRTLRNGEPKTWDWVPALLERTNLDVSHGLCPPCCVYYYSSDWGS